MAKNKNSFVIYRGPSMLDGAPIIVIATGLKGKSANTKTGHMVQTWILREDVNPLDALRSGDDVSICGDCRHRGKAGIKRSCYVNVGQAPNNIWKTYHRGRYGVASDVSAIGADRVVRIGSYGDPAAVPLHVWKALVSACKSHTGYTHQWKLYPALAPYCMASCDSEADLWAARLLGFRSFRVRKASELPLAGEITCPASKEAGHKTVCALCRACGGTSAKARVDIVIAAHGIGAAQFNKGA